MRDRDFERPSRDAQAPQAAGTGKAARKPSAAKAGSKARGQDGPESALKSTVKSAAKSAAKSAPQRRSAVDTRARILKKAVAEFAAKGYGGARIDAIAKSAQTNIRMLYHYFGSKEQLYLAVLESVINDLRLEELKLDLGDQSDALEGLLQMFDFIDSHFSRHAELRNILSGENLNRARYMKKSALIPTMSSPVLSLLQALIRKGQAAGRIRRGVDALHLYVTMVSLVSYHKTNAWTLSFIFSDDLTSEAWQTEQRRFNRDLLESYLRPTDASETTTRKRK